MGELQKMASEKAGGNLVRTEPRKRGWPWVEGGPLLSLKGEIVGLIFIAGNAWSSHLMAVVFL